MESSVLLLKVYRQMKYTFTQKKKKKKEKVLNKRQTKISEMYLLSGDVLDGNTDDDNKLVALTFILIGIY